MAITRKLTAAQWVESNPTLRADEIGIEKDTKKQKVGDGLTPWNKLSYQFTRVTADPRYAQKPNGGDYLVLDSNSKVPQVNLPDHLTDTAQKTTFAASSSGAASAQRMLAKLKRNADDVTVLIPSDSTAVHTTAEPRWGYKWAELMAQDWPTHTVRVIKWDDAAGAYDTASPLTIQTGSGPRFLRVYIAAVTGTKMDYLLGSKFEAAIASIQPDLVFTNYGLNDGSTDESGARLFGRERILTLTESITAVCPDASVIILSQNERADVVNNVLAVRATRYQRAAEELGHGFVDVRQAFAEDLRGLPSLLNADLLHPNNTGSQLIADIVHTHTRYVPNVQPRTVRPSCFTQTGNSLLTNSDFANFSAPPVLPSWTATNATLSKDTVNFEGPNGYSVRIQAASAAASYMDASFNLATVKGQVVTVAVRVRIPTGQNNTAARISIQCGDGADKTSIGNASARDGFFWVVVTKRIPTTATFARLRVYGDSTASGTADVSIDRVIAVKGSLPRDLR